MIAVGGFRVFNDKKLHASLRALSKNGVIVITDSDSAGYKIRVFLSKILHDCDITDVFVPQICGKEPRKNVPSAQGFLGVEGMSALLRFLGVQDGVSNRFLLKILNQRFTRKELADLKLDDK